MRILFFYASEIDVLGGAELSVLGLAKGLLRAGHDAAILEFADNKSKRRAIDDIPVWSLPLTLNPEFGHPHSWLSFLGSMRQFVGVVREFKPDIISIQFPVWQAPLVVAAYSLPHRWRIVVTARGSDIRVIPYSQTSLRPWQKRLFERADAVVAVSHALLRDVLNLYPFARDKTLVIHNSVATAWLDSGMETASVARGKYLLFVGLLHNVKGVDLLLRAWQLVQMKTSELLLLIAGEGPELNNLIALAEELGIAQSVEFLGVVQQKDLPALYRNAQLVVIPSRNEGLPRVALEAGACGAICVASNVGGLPEIIEHRVTGYLAEAESAEALSKAVLEALDLPPPERNRMSDAAREKIRRQFNHEKMITSYVEMFQSVLGSSER